MKLRLKVDMKSLNEKKKFLSLPSGTLDCAVADSGGQMFRFVRGAFYPIALFDDKDKEKDRKVELKQKEVKRTVYWASEKSLHGTAEELEAHSISTKSSSSVYWFQSMEFFVAGFYRIVFSVDAGVDAEKVEALECRFEVTERLLSLPSSSWSSDSAKASADTGNVHRAIVLSRPVAPVIVRGPLFSVIVPGAFRAELLDDMCQSIQNQTEPSLTLEHITTSSADVFASALAKLKVNASTAQKRPRANSGSGSKGCDLTETETEEPGPEQQDEDFNIIFDKLRAQFEELFESCILYKHEKNKWKKFMKSNKRFINYATSSSPIYLLRFIIFLVTKTSTPGGIGIGSCSAAAAGGADTGHSHEDSNATKELSTEVRTLRKRGRGTAIEIPTDLARQKLQKVLEMLMDELKF